MRRWLIGLLAATLVLGLAAAIVLWPQSRYPFRFLSQARASALKLALHETGSNYEFWILTADMRSMKELSERAAKELEAEGWVRTPPSAAYWFLPAKNGRYYVAFWKDSDLVAGRADLRLPGHRKGKLSIVMLLPRRSPTIVDGIRGWFGL